MVKPFLGIKSILFGKGNNIAGYLFLLGTLINFFIKMDTIGATNVTAFSTVLVIAIVAHQMRTL